MELQNLPPSPRKRTPVQIERAVLFALFLRELRTRVEGRWLGLLWMVFEPLAHVVAVLTIFGWTHASMRSSVELPVFLVTGLMPFFMFRNVVRRMPQAVNSSRALFAYRQVQPFDALVARALVEIGLFSTVYVIALAVLGWLGYHWLPHRPLELLAVSVALLAFAIGLGMTLAVAAHKRPRVDTVVGLVFLPLYVLSGVVLPLHNFPPDTRAVLMWNPVLHLVELSRASFVAHYAPVPGVELGYPAAWALGACALGTALYRVYRHRFTQG